MSALPSPGPSAPRHKQKPLTIGIAAGAEDAKYQAKYKDLKRKVKEIETDNDKLHFKVLQARRSIQRMKLERAILYERLAGTPTPVDVQSRHAGPPPMHQGTGAPPHPPFSRSHSGGHYQDMDSGHPSMDYERSMSDYPPLHDRARMVSGADGRPVAPIAPGVAQPSHMSGMHSPPRRSSGGQGHESSRHLPHLPSMPPPGNHGRPHVSPTLHHSHSGSSHQRARSHSSSRSRAHQQSYIPGHLQQQYPEGPVPVSQLVHSPPLLDRERSRRHENERIGSHSDSQVPRHLSSYIPRMSPPPDGRSSSRNHQRMSPGPYRDDSYDRQTVMDSDRERERRDRDVGPVRRDHERDSSRDIVRNRDAHIVSPQIGHRSRPPMDRSRVRDDPAYHRDPPPSAGGYAMHSRSGSPVSGSGSGSGNGGVDGPSRPDDSRHYYEPNDRTRSYRLRPTNPPNEEMDFVHEDGRSLSSRDRGGDRGGGGGGNFPPPEQSRSSLDSRKRGRNDMDVDSDDAGEGPVYGSGRGPEDRGKRYHREHRRSLDNLEDGRMGLP